MRYKIDIFKTHLKIVLQGYDQAFNIYAGTTCIYTVYIQTTSCDSVNNFATGEQHLKRIQGLKG